MKSILWCFFASAVLLFGAPPRRVVSQTVGSDELLLALAAPSQIASLSHLARDERYNPSFREASNYPCLRTGEIEDILRYKPDLVLVASYTQAETVKLLQRSHVQVLLLDRFDSLDDLYTNARRIGKALGREAHAESLIRQWQARVDLLGKRLQGVKPVRVLAVGLYPFTAGANTTFHDLCEHAGALNVAAEAGLKGHAPTPNEKVLTWNTEVLVAPAEPGLDLNAKLKELAPYKFMPALKRGRVLHMPGSLMAATSQARIDGYEWLARALHPERFR